MNQHKRRREAAIAASRTTGRTETDLAHHHVEKTQHCLGRRGTLFDFNFCAMGITPGECFELANKKELKPGEFRVVHWAEHWRSEMKRSKTNRKLKAA
jgi:hypothetical protein